MSIKNTQVYIDGKYFGFLSNGLTHLHDNWRILSVIKVAMALNVSVDEVLLDKYKHKGDKL